MDEEKEEKTGEKRAEVPSKPSLEDLEHRLGSHTPKAKTLRSIKTLADEMVEVSEKLSASALYINKLLEVLLLSPEEFTDLTRVGLVEKPLTLGESRRSSGPSITDLLQLTQGADVEALTQLLLSRLGKDDE